MARLVCGGAPPPSRGTRRSFQNRFAESIFGTHPLSVGVSLHPLRPETKGQAAACPDRTRAISCKVRAVTGRGADRARRVPDRPVIIGGIARSPADRLIPALTCNCACHDTRAYVLLSSRSRVRVAVGAQLSVRIPAHLWPSGSQTTEGWLLRRIGNMAIFPLRRAHYMTDPGTCDDLANGAFRLDADAGPVAWRSLAVGADDDDNRL